MADPQVDTSDDLVSRAAPPIAQQPVDTSDELLSKAAPPTAQTASNGPVDTSDDLLAKAAPPLSMPPGSGALSFITGYHPADDPTATEDPVDQNRREGIQHAIAPITNFIGGTMRPLGNLAARVGGEGGLADRALLAPQVNDLLQQGGYKTVPTAQQAFDGFINPDLLNLVRKNDAANNSWGVTKLFHEVMPPLSAGQTVGPGVSDNLIAMGANPTVAKSLGFLIGFGADISTDPLMSSSFLSPTAQGAATTLANSSGELDAMKDLSAGQALLESKSNVDPRALSQRIADGDAALIQTKIPFTNSQITIAGAPIAKVAELLAAKAEVSTVGQFYRSMSMRTGFGGADAVNNGLSIEEKGAQVLKNEMLASLPPVPPEIADKINRYVYTTGEFGPDGLKLLAKQGFNYSEAEMAMGDEIRGKLYQFDKYTTDYARISGKEIGNYEPLVDNAQKAKYLQENSQKNIYSSDLDPMERLNTLNDPRLGSQPSMLTGMNFDGTDFTFSQSRGFPRKLTAGSAQALDEASKTDAVMGKNGLSTGVSANLERSKFSTEMQNRILSQTTGAQENFRLDVANVVAESGMEKMRAGRNLKYMESLKNGYGDSMDGWVQRIDSAQQKVQAGLANAEDIKIAQMQVRPRVGAGGEPILDASGRPIMEIPQLRQINTKGFGDISSFIRSNDEGTTFIKENEKPLYYPQSVAQTIENVVATPNPGAFRQFVDYMSSQWKKNVLTSGKRFVLHFDEGLSNYASLAANPKYIFTELRNLAGDGLDKIANILDRTPLMGSPADVTRSLAEHAYGAGLDTTKQALDNSPILENIFTDKPLPPKITVSKADMADPMLNYPSNAYYELLHGAARNGTLKNVLDTVVDEGMKNTGISSFVDKAGNIAKVGFGLFNDNPLSKGIREMGALGTNIFKRARVRDLLDQGFSLNDAMQRASFEFLDFRTPNSAFMQGGSVLNPFFAYNVKNWERNIAILAQRPGMYNMVNPYDGALQRNLLQADNWSTRQQQVYRDQFKLPTDDSIIAGTFHGFDSVKNNVAGLHDLLDKYLSWGTDQGMKDQLAQGRDLWVRLPTNISAMSDFTRIKNYQDPASTGPYIKFGLAALGYDPFTGEKMPYAANDIDRYTTALQQVNPYDFPRLSMALTKVIDNWAPQWRDHVENFGLEPRVMQLFNSIFGSRFAGGALKMDNLALNQMTAFKGMDLFSLTKSDIQLDLNHKAIARDMQQQIKQSLSDVERKGQKFRMDILQQTTLPEMQKQTQNNAKAMRDYQFRQRNLKQMVGENHPALQEPHLEVEGQ